MAAVVLTTIQNLTAGDVHVRSMDEGRLIGVDFGDRTDAARVTLLDGPDAVRAVLVEALRQLDANGGDDVSGDGIITCPEIAQARGQIGQVHRLGCGCDHEDGAS